MFAAFLSAHDVRFFLAAVLASLLGTLLCFHVLPAHGTPRSHASISRTIGGGTLLGATIWIAFRLSLAGYFPFLPANVPWPSAVCRSCSRSSAPRPRWQ